MQHLRTHASGATPLLAGALLLLAAPGKASAQAAPPAFDPVGIYSFTISVEGLEVAGTITITEGEDGYEGMLTTDTAPAVPFTSVTVEGQRVTIEGVGMTGTLILELTATEEGMAGTWTLGARSGELVLKRTG